MAGYIYIHTQHIHDLTIGKLQTEDLLIKCCNIIIIMSYTTASLITINDKMVFLF